MKTLLLHAALGQGRLSKRCACSKHCLSSFSSLHLCRSLPSASHHPADHQRPLNEPAMRSPLIRRPKSRLGTPYRSVVLNTPALFATALVRPGLHGSFHATHKLVPGSQLSLHVFPEAERISCDSRIVRRVELQTLLQQAVVCVWEVLCQWTHSKLAGQGCCPQSQA